MQGYLHICAATVYAKGVFKRIDDGNMVASETNFSMKCCGLQPCKGAGLGPPICQAQRLDQFDQTKALVW